MVTARKKVRSTEEEGGTGGGGGGGGGEGVWNKNRLMMELAFE